MDLASNPFTDSLPAEIPLPNAPLLRVIAQIRFPTVLSIEKREFVAGFQEAIRLRYPILRAEKTQGILLGSDGPMSVPPATTWRFTDLEDAWRISLAPDFVAIETTAYRSRQDLLSRLEEVVNALDAHVEPKMIDRLGVRYIDRIQGQAFQRIAQMVRREMLGVGGTQVAKNLDYSLTEALFSLKQEKAQLRARWGLLPPQATVDPAAIEPVDEHSWILDLDLFSSEPCQFNSASVVADARIYAERAYAFFRWAITDEFLKCFGGEV